MSKQIFNFIDGLLKTSTRTVWNIRASHIFSTENKIVTPKVWVLCQHFKCYTTTVLPNLKSIANWTAISGEMRLHPVSKYLYPIHSCRRQHYQYNSTKTHLFHNYLK